MALELPDHVWFVRSNGGSGSYPVKAEGWLVVVRFIVGVMLSVLAAVAFSLFGTLVGPMWVTFLAIPAFVLGMGWSAWRFIDVARKHTAYDITYNQWAAQAKAGKQQTQRAFGRQ